MTKTSGRPSLNVLAEIPDQDLKDIIDAIKAGAETPAEGFGFTPEALSSIEQIAHSYFSARVYGKAAVIYGFLLRMSPSRGTAWRGLGACAHAIKRFEEAARAYELAVQNDDKDVVSKVYWGEVLCQLGDKTKGLKLLKDVIATGTKEPLYKPYITRARAIVSADGGIPPKIVLMRDGEKVAQSAEAMLEEAGLALDPDKEITPEDILKNPSLRASISELSKALSDGRITLAKVGGFSQKELDGAYAVACKYMEAGQTPQALQIAGYLIMLAPGDQRFFQLVGIGLQRMKMYNEAEYFYGIAVAITDKDARTQVYRGESRIMAGEIDKGLEYVRKGAELAAKDPTLADVADRAKVLLRQFAR